MVDETRVLRLLRAVSDDVVLARLADPSDLTDFVRAVSSWLNIPRP